MSVIPIPALRDNYIWMLPLTTQPDRVVIVDPGEAAPVGAALDRLGLQPAAILVTHHHLDHTGGISELQRRHRLAVFGPAGASPAVDHPIADGMTVRLGDLELRVMAVPGHTLEHVAYYAPGMLLCGDTLFGAGCGRLFEGTPAQMYESLMKFAALPEDTRVYCSHEYTAANLAFAAAVEPDNEDVRARIERVALLRASGRPSLPSTIGEELRTNPFLRCREPDVSAAARRHAGTEVNGELGVFTALRRWKDVF
ncbi:MAG: hydroxyacylglutathione hydrolase [Gammaproteobacteria bacterium]|nr:hydroxyacylglutathione hydrolase [Gammaproteobacteria bacterium]